MADTDQAYKDDVAPDGSPYRPLYDDKIMFSGQPIALVRRRGLRRPRALRRRWCASNTKTEPHVTDIYRQRDAAVPKRLPIRSKPVRAAEAARRCRAGAGRRRGAPRGRILRSDRASQPDGALRLDGDLGGGGKLTVYDKTQGVQNVQRYLCSVFGMKPDEVRVMSPYMGGGVRLGPAPAVSGRAGGAGGARAEALGARRADARSRCMRSATGRR